MFLQKQMACLIQKSLTRTSSTRLSSIKNLRSLFCSLSFVFGHSAGLCHGLQCRPYSNLPNPSFLKVVPVYLIVFDPPKIAKLAQKFSREVIDPEIPVQLDDFRPSPSGGESLQPSRGNNEVNNNGQKANGESSRGYELISQSSSDS
jgi:hypothetical protein